MRQKSEEHNLNTWSRAPEASSQTKGGSYMDDGEDYKGDQDSMESHVGNIKLWLTYSKYIT